MMQAFYGAWPALITPATSEGDVNVTVLRKLTEYLLEKGVDGLYLCGSTGEGLFMSLEDRQLVLEEVLNVVKGHVPVIMHVGCVASRDAMALARHAQETGADGISSLLPPVARYEASTHLHYEAIASAAPSLPFFAYLFGGQTDAVTLMQTLLKRIPNVGGAKYTGPNMEELRQLVTLRDTGWTIFSGMDQQCVFAAMFGAQANIGSTLNAIPGIYKEIRKNVAEGDIARARDLQIRANQIARTLKATSSFFGALGEAMRMLGFECGEPRLPTPTLSEEERETLRERLAAVDFTEIAAM